MNRKLQALTDEFIRELHARLPDLTLEAYPQSRKSVYIYMTASDPRMWDDDKVLDLIDSMGEKQVDTLVKTGYSFHLLPRLPVRVPAMATALREPSPEWPDAMKTDVSKQ